MNKFRITLDAQSVATLIRAMGREIAYDDGYIQKLIETDTKIELLADSFAVRAKHIALKSRLEKLIGPPKKRRK